MTARGIKFLFACLFHLNRTNAARRGLRHGIGDEWYVCRIGAAISLIQSVNCIISPVADQSINNSFTQSKNFTLSPIESPFGEAPGFLSYKSLRSANFGSWWYWRWDMGGLPSPAGLSQCELLTVGVLSSRP